MANATLFDLFGNDILLHYDASVAASLFTDTGGTTPASDGNEVKCWKPQSDASLQVNLTHTTGPTYRSNYVSSGYPALEFDGSNDALLNASTGLTTSQKVFIIAVFQPLNSFGTIWCRGDTAAWSRAYYGTDSENIQQSAGSSVSITSGLPSGRRVVAYVVGTSQTQLDALGYSAGSQSISLISSLTGAITIGALNTGSLSQYGNLAFNEILAIGSSCEWGQVIRGAKILRDKWGVTDPNGYPQKSGGRIVHPFLQQVIG